MKVMFNNEQSIRQVYATNIAIIRLHDCILHLTRIAIWLTSKLLVSHIHWNIEGETETREGKLPSRKETE